MEPSMLGTEHKSKWSQANIKNSAFTITAHVDAWPIYTKYICFAEAAAVGPFSPGLSGDILHLTSQFPISCFTFHHVFVAESQLLK